jgi:hypothetical protein
VKAERRATRNRVYSLVGGLVILVAAIAALRSMALLGQEKIGQKLYPFPGKVLKKLAEVQARYRQQDLDQDGKKAFAGSLAELEAAGCIMPDLAQGPVKGYRYAIVRADAFSYWLTAEPDGTAPIGTDTLFYAVDETQVVRAEVAAPVTSRSGVFLHPLHGDSLWSGPRPASEPAPDPAERSP